MPDTTAPPTLSISGTNARAVADLADAVARLNDQGVTVEVLLTGTIPAAAVPATPPKVVHRASKSFAANGIVGVQGDLFALLDAAGTPPAPADVTRAPRRPRPTSATRSLTVIERFAAHGRKLLPFAADLGLVPAQARKLLDSAGVGQGRVSFGSPTPAQADEMARIYLEAGTLKAVRDWLGSTGNAHVRLMLRAAGIKIRTKHLRARPDELTDESLRDLWAAVNHSKKQVAQTLHVDTYYAHELLFEAGLVDVDGTPVVAS